MSADKEARLKEAAEKALAEIKAELERYTEWLSKATDDPNNFVTMSQIEILDRDGVAYCDANC